MMRVTIDVSRAVKQLGAFEKQIPFARAAALNDLAFQAMRAENDAIAKLFAHPRPFTQRATQVEQKATKAVPLAIVSIRTAQDQYLDPYEYGGEHELPGKVMLEPVDIRVDAFGQLPKGTLARLRQDPTVFVGTVHGINGFWKRGARDVRETRARGKDARALKAAQVRGTLTLLIRILPNRPVGKQLNFEERAFDLVAAQSEKAVTDAIDRALRTALR